MTRAATPLHCELGQHSALGGNPAAPLPFQAGTGTVLLRLTLIASASCLVRGPTAATRRAGTVNFGRYLYAARFCFPFFLVFVVIR